MKFRILSLSLILVLFLSTRGAAQVHTGRDYRYLQSPVKHQEDRGTCTAFAVCGALETFPGVPSDLSEQYLYSWLKLDYYNANDKQVIEGDFLSNYPGTLEKWGTVHESREPYRPDAIVWKDDQESMEKLSAEMGGSRIYDLLQVDFPFIVKAENCAFYDRTKAADIEFIKTLLDDPLGPKCIPAGYLGVGIDWGEFEGHNADTVKMDLGFKVMDGSGDTLSWRLAKLMHFGLTGKLLTGELTLIPAFHIDNYGGHAVGIVGYNETGFIIKNSWGTGWGMDGYAVLEYDFHRLFAQELLVITKVENRSFNYNQCESPVSGIDADIRLKSRPAPNGALELSIFSPVTQCLSDMFSVEYRVLPQGKLIQIARETQLFASSFRGKGVAKILEAGGLDRYSTYDVELIIKFERDGSAVRRLYKGVKIANLEYAAAEKSWVNP